MKVGDKIRIIEMDGEPEYSNRTGIVELIDDAGQLHGTWGGLAVIPGVDKFTIINDDMEDMDRWGTARGTTYSLDQKKGD